MMRRKRLYGLLLCCVLLPLLGAARPACAAPEDWAQPFRLERVRLRKTQAGWAPPAALQKFCARVFFEDLLLVQDLNDPGPEAMTPPEAKRRQRNRSWLVDQARIRGEDPITRIDALRALALAQGVDPSETDPVPCGFRDVPPDQGPFVSHYVEAGVVSGYEDGTFRPEGWLTADEAAAIVFGALYAPVRAVRPAPAKRLALDELVQTEWQTEQSEWAFGLLQRNAPSGVIRHDGAYPVGCGRLCLLRAPRIESDACGRRWIVLDMRYAHEMDTAFGIHLICDGGTRVRHRGNFREMQPGDDGVQRVYYPAAAKDDSYTCSEQGDLLYHFEDESWSRYEGEGIDGLVLHDPLFPDEALYVSWPE